MTSKSFLQKQLTNLRGVHHIDLEWGKLIVEMVVQVTWKYHIQVWFKFYF